MLTLEDYDLYSDSILGRITDDEDAFLNCALGNYNRVAHRFGCSVSLSAARLADARELWLRDLRSLLGHGIDASDTLDQYKQAAFLTFWLRRCKPINEVFADKDLGPSADVDLRRDWFQFYGNEICALHVGAKLCQAYCLRELIEKAAQSDGQATAALFSRRQQLTRHVEIAPDFEYDCIIMLKHKNTSPHAITLIYEALFSGLATRTVAY